MAGQAIVGLRPTCCAELAAKEGWAWSRPSPSAGGAATLRYSDLAHGLGRSRRSAGQAESSQAVIDLGWTASSTCSGYRDCEKDDTRPAGVTKPGSHRQVR